MKVGKAPDSRTKGQQNPCCLDCGDDRFSSLDYVVRRETWEESGLEQGHIVCLSCMETHLGRILTDKDFPNVGANCFVMERLRWCREVLVEDHPLAAKMFLTSWVVSYIHLRYVRLLNEERRKALEKEKMC